MIFEIRHHGDGFVAAYNIFVSQRPAVILSENDIQAPADRMNLTEFLITSFSISKIEIKVPKRMNSRTPIRGAIAPAEDITLRCNHSSSHVKWSVGAPQGIEIAPASEFHDFRGLSPPPASLFPKISWFSKFDLMTADAWHRITFLLRNDQPCYFQKMIFKHRRTKRFRQNF